MISRNLLRSAVFGVALSAIVPVAAMAAPVVITLDEGDGSNLINGSVTVTQNGDNLDFLLQTNDPNGNDVADIYGLFFHLDPALLGASFQVLNATAPTTVCGPSSNAITSCGDNSNNVNGASGAPFDLGFQFGTSGLNGGSDDFQTVSFTLDANVALNLATFFEEGNDRIAMRLQSIGPVTGQRGESAKLVGDIPDITNGNGNGTPVPEPASLALVAAGLAGLAARRRRA